MRCSLEAAIDRDTSEHRCKLSTTMLYVLFNTRQDKIDAVRQLCLLKIIRSCLQMMANCSSYLTEDSSKLAAEVCLGCL